MRKLLLVLMLALVPAAAFAGGRGEAHLDPVKIDLGDKPSLQRGARIFVNYCLSCHSAAYMRYNRMGKDLGISEELVEENLLFAADKVGDLMKAVMPKDEAKATFGVAPPDLTLVARSRGPEWVYTYMRSFYRDDKSVSGWNNMVFPHVAMPHVLYEWQGEQRPVYKIEKQTTHVEQDGKQVEKVVETSVFEKFELAKPGTMKPAEYDRSMRDLTNFLVYLGEPAKLDRYRIGGYVLLFLAIFLVFAYLLKKEYWKDVH
ncbi:MAG: cytochrome c1 [Gammaproteobacteria bacterium]|nr:cytochrome c1 [Gammaproteobacteria bacterium]